MFEYIAPFAVGFLLALVFEPLVARLGRRFKIPRGVLALLSVLFVLLVIGSVGTVAAVRIADEARALAETLPSQFEAVSRGFDSLKSNYLNILEFVPEELRETADSLGGIAVSSLTAGAGTFVRGFSTSMVRIVPGTLIGVILSFVSMFFFIKDHEAVVALVSAKSPRSLARGYAAVRRGLFDALAGYIRAEALIMLVSGCICLTGLMLLRYPYALLLARLVAFFDFLPVFGAGFVLWPWALGAAFAGNLRMAVGLLMTYAVITVARQIFEPKILGSQIGLHPLIMLMSMFIGLKVFGAQGFFIGPFIVITIKVMNELESDKGVE